jgi:hypothetical protein
MKKGFLLLLFTGLYAITLHSQTLHLRVGVAPSRLNWTQNPGGFERTIYKAPVLGYALGLGIEYLDRQWFSLSSDFNFYRSGGKYTSEEEMQVRQYSEVILDYGSFSTVINFNPLHGATKVQLQLGPRVDFLLGGKNQESLFEINQVEGLTEINYGFNVGLGLYRSFRKTQIGLQGTWLQRFEDLVPFTYTRTGVGNEGHETIFLLQLSLGLHLK